MIYFIKTYFQNDEEKQRAESSLRKSALRRHTSLDLQSSVWIGTDKLFLGLEGSKEIKFTRIRTSFEKILPKLIINLPKDRVYYQIRFSLLSTVVFLLMSFALVLTISSLIAGRIKVEKLLTFGIFCSFYLLLLLIELRLTKARIKKCNRQNF